MESAVPAPSLTNAPNRDDVEVRIKGDKEFYDIEYDKLVIAVGCYSASLGIEGVSEPYSVSDKVRRHGGQD